MTAKPFCNGVTRRDFIHLGGAGVFGMGLNLPTILQAQERAAARGQTTRDVSLIFLFLHGGLSTIDTWDMKPNAPVEFRGEFGPIQTNVSGMDICELMPLQAKIADQFSILRGLRTRGNHDPTELLTGIPAAASGCQTKIGRGQARALPPRNSSIIRCNFQRQAFPRRACPRGPSR